MSKIKTYNSIIMVAGTSIGSGILGLPIITANAGILPTLLAFICCWVFMTVAAFYILNVKMKLRGNYNMSSLAKLTLGKWGELCCAAMIVLLLYALLCTYTMTGAAWLALLIPSIKLPSFIMAILFICIFGSLILFSEHATYGINKIFGIGLVITFLLTICSSLLPRDYSFLAISNFSFILPAMPLLMTTFGFSIVVPTMTEYLDYDYQTAKIAIIVGSLIALLAYAAWEWVTFSHISLEQINLLQINGDNGTGIIQALSGNSWQLFTARLFAVFAVTTSFLGVSLSLIHFLGDTIQKKSRISLALLMYIPPLIVIHFYPKAFVQILSLSGIFVAVLLGLLPTMMFYKLQQAKHSTKQLVAIFAACVFFVLVILQEVINLIG